jgi:hypothetical protein
LLAERYALAVVTVEATFVILHFAFGDDPLFNLDREYNPSSWFSALQLAAAGLVCVVAFHRDRRVTSGRWLWWILAAGFCYASFDEAMVVHERVLIGQAPEALAAASSLRGVPPWQIVLAPGVALASLAFASIFASRFADRPECWMPATGGLALWGGAFVLEGTVTTAFMPGGLYEFEVALEEFMEMAGATLVLFGLARYALSTEDTRLSRHAIPAWKRSLAWALPMTTFLLLPASVILVVSAHAGAGAQRAAGERLLAAERHADAVAAFRAAIEADPGDAAALRGLGTAAYRAGDLDLAESALRRAARRAPEDETIRNALDLLAVKAAREKPQLAAAPEDPHAPVEYWPNAMP